MPPRPQAAVGQQVAAAQAQPQSIVQYITSGSSVTVAARTKTTASERISDVVDRHRDQQLRVPRDHCGFVGYTLASFERTASQLLPAYSSANRAVARSPAGRLARRLCHRPAELTRALVARARTGACRPRPSGSSDCAPPPQRCQARMKRHQRDEFTSTSTASRSSHPREQAILRQSRASMRSHSCNRGRTRMAAAARSRACQSRTRGQAQPTSPIAGGGTAERNQPTAAASEPRGHLPPGRVGLPGSGSAF